jgi:hypothetical protein
MDRSQVLVIAAIVAAIGLFTLRILSDSEVDDERRHQPAVSRGAGGSGSEGAGAPAGSDGGSGAATRRGPGGETARRLAAGSRSGAAAERDAMGGSSEAVAGPGGRRGGTVGSAITSRPDAGGSSVGFADASAGGPGHGPDRQRERSEVAELLKAQPAAPPAWEGAATDPEEEVVLSIAHPDDTAPALQNTDIEEPDDGIGVNFTDDSVVSMPNAGNARGDAGSVSFDVEPEWVGSDDTNHSFVQLHTDRFENRMELVKNGRYLRFVFADNTGAERDISFPLDAWQPGERHSITATWGEAATALYIDGRLVGQNTYSGQLEIAPGTPMYIGSRHGNYQGANARIENFKVYGRPLSADEVASR